ncbi:uncharacterized protein LOC144884959 [Branchiostoma floridae x Branchiostoma japonicum]
MASLKMEAALQINSNACVVVSGLSDRVNCKKMRERLQSGNSDSKIKRLVTLSTMGTALVELLTPKDAADMLANETMLQVRRLRSMTPQGKNVTALKGRNILHDLRTFVQSLPFPRDQFQQGLESGASQVSKGRFGLTDLDMHADACVVVSGFPADVNSTTFRFSINPAECIRQAVVFPAAGTALMEFFAPEWAAIFLANENRLLEETGLQVKQLESVFSPKEDISTLQKEQELLKRLLETVKLEQTLGNKEQQLQHVMAEMEQFKTAYRREEQEKRNALVLCRRLKEDTVHLTNQREADKREIRRLSLKEQISSTNDGSSSYDMSRDPSGVAVIINNIHFEDMPERDGAEGDTDRLREAFENLRFSVFDFQDLDNTGMWKVIKEHGKADHSNYDCFVCVIMSHGTMGKVYSSDDVGIDICELMKPVNAKKCPSLKGKPKLFFIQACQGDKTQGREGFDHGEYDAKPVPFICHEADFFLGLATVPGYVARRDQDGAPYVHHLAKLLKDFGPTHDLSAIMAMVCDKMNDINDDKFGWISSNHSTLRKKVVFKAK